MESVSRVCFIFRDLYNPIFWGGDWIVKLIGIICEKIAHGIRLPIPMWWKEEVSMNIDIGTIDIPFQRYIYIYINYELIFGEVEEIINWRSLNKFDILLEVGATLITELGQPLVDILKEMVDTVDVISVMWDRLYIIWDMYMFF